MDFWIYPYLWLLCCEIQLLAEAGKKDWCEGCFVVHFRCIVFNFMVNRKISLTTFTLPSVIQNGIHSWCSCLEGRQRWIYARDKLPSIVRKTFGQWIVFMCCTEVWIFTDFDSGLWNKDLIPKKQVKLVLKLNCLYALIGCLTLYKRWETKCWSFKGSVSPKQSLP